MNPGTELRAVVFDVDGTLIDTLGSLVAAADDVLRAAGLFTIPAAFLVSALSRGLPQFIRRALVLQPIPAPEEVWPLLERRFLEHYAAQRLSDAKPYPGLTDALRSLRDGGLRLAICTNRDRRSTIELLAHAAAADLFDTVVAREDAPAPKPAPEPLLIALARLGVAPGAALFVGDSQLDCRCAEAAGVAFAAHGAGYAANANELRPRVYEYRQLGALAKWILDRREQQCGPVPA